MTHRFLNRGRIGMLSLAAALFVWTAVASAQPRAHKRHIADIHSLRDDAPFTPTRFAAAKPNLPTLFIAGDSTAATGKPTRRGWGAVLIDFFDTSRLNIINRAAGGRSFRTFTREGRWGEIVNHLKPGDFVIIEFGHNDDGVPARSRNRRDLPGIGNETMVVTDPNGARETVHTFGWYARKYIRDTRAKGATPILSTTTVRNKWHGNRVERGVGHMLDWAREVAKQEHALFVDHSDITADVYEKMGFDAVQKFFPGDHTHTDTAGAIVNARTLIAGLKTLAGIGPILSALNAKGRSIEPHPPRNDWGTYHPPPPTRRAR